MYRKKRSLTREGVRTLHIGRQKVMKTSMAVLSLVVIPGSGGIAVLKSRKGWVCPSETDRSSGWPERS